MTQDRDIDVVHDVSSFVSELRRLADALESGSAFTIHVDGEDVTIPDGAQFSVSHEREDGEVELEFQATWSVDPVAEHAADDLVAHADEPEADSTVVTETAQV